MQNAAGHFDRLSRRSAWRRAAGLLEAAGVEMAGLEARYLLCAAAGISPVELRRDGERKLGGAAGRRLRALLARRLRHEPLARILGHAEFYGIELVVNDHVLDPRGDTETIVQAALARIAPDRVLRILDLGTGSGAILAALLTHCPRAFGVATDISPQAAATASLNLARLQLAARSAVLVADWARPLAARFDLVVSNPPYLARAAIGTLAPEVRDFDPLVALDGGQDGLDAYRAIFADLPRLLQPDGLLAVEIGAGQASNVCALLTASGLEPAGTARDTAGLIRVVFGQPRKLLGSQPETV
jgi:release factor glutamine methyltransferase